MLPIFLTVPLRDPSLLLMFSSCSHFHLHPIEQALYPLLASMLTMKAWDDVTSNDISRLHAKGSGGENTVVRSFAEKYIGEIGRLLSRVPSDLLLVMKVSLDRVI